MTMLSFKQVESNPERAPCEQGCSWIIKFSHCLNIRYHKYVIFSIQTQNGCTRRLQEKNM